MRERRKDAYSCARWAHIWTSHHARYKRFIAAMPRKLVCQECGGSGGEVVPVTNDGQGPFESCGYCESTGYMTPHARGMWLRWHRERARTWRAIEARALAARIGLAEAATP